MADPRKQDCVENDETGDSDRADQSNGGGLEDSSSSDFEFDATSVVSRENDDEVGLAERLTDILVNEGDGDLLLQQNDREDRLLQWLQALDLQVMGACRADERLKPLLKLNVSGGSAEDRLLSHLNQHFEASEVGMLTRCLCIPLVSIRVGKILKQGTLLCPTATRGNLNLMLLPTSDLRISFIGDDGFTERLATLHSIGQCSAATIEEIPADSSGRSFSLKVPDSQFFYFWCSEKSKLLGDELLAKMKNLLQKSPSLAELTGISEARLSCFVTHLRAYLYGSTVNNPRANLTAPSLVAAPDHVELGESAQFTSSTIESSRSRNYCSRAVRANLPYQGRLSLRSSSFNEGLPRNSSLRTTTRENFRTCGDSHVSAVENLPPFTTITADASSSYDSEKDRAPEGAESCPLSSSSFLDSLGRSTIPPFLSSGSHGPPTVSSFFSPCYCWCPPFVSTLQYSVAPSQQQTSEPVSLPPLSSFLPTTRSSGLLNPLASLDLSIPSADFPAFLPEPLIRLPFSSPSLQQIATFTPLMCDPIVHIPVIDVCSSGQGYLVSTGSAISTAIPPLHQNIVNPLGPETDSAVEKGARETLRLLISSSDPATPQLMDIFPAVLSSNGDEQGVMVAGSRGLYSGSQDVGSVASSIAAIGLVSLTGRSFGESILNRCSSQEELENQTDQPGGPVASSSDDRGSIFSNFTNEQ